MRGYAQKTMSLLASFIIAIFFSFPLTIAATNASQLDSQSTDTTAFDSDTAAQKSLTDYIKQLEMVYESDNNSDRESNINSLAEDQVGYLRDTYINSGMHIQNAEIDTKVLTASRDGSDMKIATEMTTVITYEYRAEDGQHTDYSSSTDIHNIILKKITGHTYTITSDTLVPEEETDVASSPSSSAPLDISSDPGLTSEQVLTQLNSTDMSLPPHPYAGAKPVVEPQLSADYALKWTAPPYDGDEREDYNSDYPYNGELHDCTNFLSQAVHAGGLQYQLYDYDPYNSLNWKPTIMFRNGYTWHNAEASYQYMKKNAYNIFDDIRMDTGSLIYVDWSNSGKMSHALMITSAGRIFLETGEIRFVPNISQKSRNRHNEPLQTYVARAVKENPNLRWHPLATRWIPL